MKSQRISESGIQRKHGAATAWQPPRYRHSKNIMAWRRHRQTAAWRGEQKKWRRQRRGGVVVANIESGSGSNSSSKA